MKKYFLGLIAAVVILIISSVILADPITLAVISTRLHLASYEIFNNHEALADYLTKYDGEAVDSQKLYVLAKWILEKQISVEDFLSSIRQDNKSDFSIRLKLVMKEIKSHEN